VLLNQSPAIFVALCLLTLTSCANSTNSKALESSFAADPRLKDSPAVVGASPSPQSSPSPPRQELPTDFPSEIPLYPEAQLVADPAAANQPTAAGKLTRWQTVDPSNFVQIFYQQALQSNGWKISSQNAASDTIIAKRNNLQVTVTTQAIPPQTSPTPSTSPTANPSPKNITEFTIEYLTDSGMPSPTSSPNVTASPAPSTPTSATPQTFKDLDKVPKELRQYVQDMAALGILNLAPTKNPAASNLFEPSKVITRREYVRWLVAANNKMYANNPGKQIRLAAESSQPAFQDILKTDPDFAAIQGLAEAGLIPSPLTGDSTSVTFRPDSPLTRENLILWKVPLDSRQALPNASLDAVKQTWGFQDASKIDPKALRAVLADFQNGDLANIRRVLGYTTLFQPKKPVSRAEAVAVLWYFGAQGEGVSAKDALQVK